MSICLGIIKVGSCNKSTNINKTIIDKQLNVVNSIVSDISSTVIATSTVSLANIVEFNIVDSGGTIIIKDIDISQYAKLTSNVDIKIVDKFRSVSNITQMTKQLVDIAFDQYAKAGFLSGDAKNVSDMKQNLQTEIVSSISEKFSKKDTFKCINDALNRTSINIKTKKSDIIITGIHVNQAIDGIVKCSINAFIDAYNEYIASQTTIDHIKTIVVEKSKSEGLPIMAIAGGLIAVAIIFLLVMGLKGRKTH